MTGKENHNKALDRLQEYKLYLQNQVLELKKLDEKSEFMKKWNETTIKERQQEIAIIDNIIKNLIRF
ncbi:MAG: hypothetical protein ACE5RN_08245 [Nitrosopumilaceae archaeon]